MPPSFFPRLEAMPAERQTTGPPKAGETTEARRPRPHSLGLSSTPPPHMCIFLTVHGRRRKIARAEKFRFPRFGDRHGNQSRYPSSQKHHFGGG